MISVIKTAIICATIVTCWYLLLNNNKKGDE